MGKSPKRFQSEVELSEKILDVIRGVREIQLRMQEMGTEWFFDAEEHFQHLFRDGRTVLRAIAFERIEPLHHVLDRTRLDDGFDAGDEADEPLTFPRVFFLGRQELPQVFKEMPGAPLDDDLLSEHESRGMRDFRASVANHRFQRVIHLFERLKIHDEVDPRL